MAAYTKDAASQLNDMLARQNASQGYTPKTSDQIRAQAEGEYQSYYDQLRLAAQQQQERTDLALQQQREGLARSYDRQREASIQDYNLRYSQADRQMLSRGMQRSSYGAQVLANIGLRGAEAQRDLWDAQVAAEGNIDAQRAQLQGQLADKLGQYDANQAADILSRIRALEDQEYERGQANTQYNNQLSAQIYQFLYQAEQDRLAREQWQKQFDENVRQFNEQIKNTASSSSGGGGGKASSAAKTTGATGTTKTTGSAGLDYNSFMNALSGTGISTKKTLPASMLEIQKKNTKVTGGGEGKATSPFKKALEVLQLN